MDIFHCLSTLLFSHEASIFGGLALWNYLPVEPMATSAMACLVTTAFFAGRLRLSDRDPWVSALVSTSKETPPHRVHEGRIIGLGFEKPRRTMVHKCHLRQCFRSDKDHRLPVLVNLAK